MAQARVNNMEIATPGYQLVNSGMGISLKREKTNWEFSIAANNILNEVYYDHLSRFKNFNLNNVGRDISLRIKIQFIKSLKSQNHE